MWWRRWRVCETTRGIVLGYVLVRQRGWRAHVRGVHERVRRWRHHARRWWVQKRWGRGLLLLLCGWRRLALSRGPRGGLVRVGGVIVEAQDRLEGLALLRGRLGRLGEVVCVRGVHGRGWGDGLLRILL